VAVVVLMGIWFVRVMKQQHCPTYGSLDLRCLNITRKQTACSSTGIYNLLNLTGDMLRLRRCRCHVRVARVGRNRVRSTCMSRTAPLRTGLRLRLWHSKLQPCLFETFGGGRPVWQSRHIVELGRRARSGVETRGRGNSAYACSSCIVVFIVS